MDLHYEKTLSILYKKLHKKQALFTGHLLLFTLLRASPSTKLTTIAANDTVLHAHFEQDKIKCSVSCTGDQIKRIA